MPRIYIGIDPGKSGGLVALQGKIVQVCPMPLTLRDVWDWFDKFGQMLTPKVAVIVALTLSHPLASNLNLYKSSESR